MFLITVSSVGARYSCLGYHSQYGYGEEETRRKGTFLNI